MSTDCDVVVIGAGVSGLATAATLSRAGRSVICLEASNSIGGRIRTVHDPLSAVPIELGAEFVHGRPPEIWDSVRDAGLTVCANTAHAIHMDQGRILADTKIGKLAERSLARLAKSHARSDESFGEFLRHSRQKADVKTWARIYVEGFNAARSEVIGVESLKQDKKAAEKIDGERTFRILDGYDAVPAYFLRCIRSWPDTIRLQSMVERVQWRRGHVAVHYRRAGAQSTGTLTCSQLMVTVPLGVLQAEAAERGGIRFEPEPGNILKAARKLAFGQAYRVTFQFAEAFWVDDGHLKDFGFLLSREKLFPTWWSTYPAMSANLTAWTAGSAADELSGLEPAAIADRALESLRRILRRTIPQPRSFHFRDWQRDPFVRGAYSYTPAGALPARRQLGRPVDQTLYFAGEAAESNGHSGTVHGAIASGVRAAKTLLEDTSAK